MAYQKINSTPNGPSALDGTEYGDSWDGAMKKVDAMFAELFALVEMLQARVQMLEATKPGEVTKS